MRVSSQLDAALLLTATCALLSACASKALDEATEPSATPSAGKGGAEQPSGGGGSVSSPSGGETSSGAAPTYQKQDYPAGPYGTTAGSTLENFSFLGWRDPVASGYDVSKLEPVRLGEFYNPDGRSNVRMAAAAAASSRSS